MTKTEKSIYIDIIMGAKEIDLLPNGKIKNITNVKSLKQQELIDIVKFINEQIKTNNSISKKLGITIVECVNNEYHEKYLTIGKQYIVNRENEYVYNVNDDSGLTMSYKKSDFKLVI